ncbi:MAG: hypothetical protein AABY22_07075 [Nanoarchaeota archaeon]
MKTTLQDIKTYQQLMDDCLKSYTEMGKTLIYGGCEQQEHVYKAMNTVWTQYLNWKEKLEESKRNI